MPLTAEYTWVESETMIRLQVPLKGHSKSNLDVFATECYLKVSFPPYLLEVDLDGCIDSVQPRARVENGTLIIKAKKKEGSIRLWGSLGQLADRKSSAEAKARRDESIKEKFKQEQELKERISLRKHQDERLALRSQMSLEEDERRRIEDIKAEEKEKAEADVYRVFAELAAKQGREEPRSIDKEPAPAKAQPKDTGSWGHHQQGRLTQPKSVDCSPRHHLDTIDEGTSDEGSPIPTAIASGTTAAAKVDHENLIWEEGTGGSDHGNGEESRHREAGGVHGGSSSHDADDSSEQDEEQEDRDHVDAAQLETADIGDNDDDDDTAVSFTPAPRTSTGVVEIGFTTRLFPTPLRESKVADESAWIMKNRRHLHKNKSLVGRLPAEQKGSGGGEEELPLDISESDPVWLKGRGDDLYRGGDFLAAVNAYTAALDADPRAAACFSNRAACYLHLCGAGNGNPSGHKYASACVADCGAALEILEKSPETGPSQGRALARRSLAHRELGQYRCSLEDSRAALVFNPGNPGLLDEIARGEPLAQGERCKKEAATCFASGDIAGACDMYTAALQAVPNLPSALSNRAACFLALGKPRECVRDCTAVLEMLSAPVFGESPGAPIADGSGCSQDATTCVTANDEEEQQLPRSTTAVAAAQAALAPSSSPPLPPPPVGSMPPAGSEKRTKWVLATLMRRARANVQLEDLEGAIRDYRTADSVRPGDKAVEQDIRELKIRAREVEKPLVR